MDIRIKIQKNQIHHWLDAPVYDTDGNKIGTKEVLQFDMDLLDYPDLPTYGMEVDYPIDKNKVLQAIKTKLITIKEQILRDNLIRQNIEDMGYLDFVVTISD